MRNFFKVLRYTKSYWPYITANIFSNIFSVVFNLVSLTMVIPFLDLLFLKTDSEYRAHLAKGVPAFHLSIESATDSFYYYFIQVIVEDGKLSALFFMCILVVILFFLKNVFRYLALYLINPVLNGIGKDMRSDLYKKIIDLPLSYFSEEKKGDLMSRMASDVQELKFSVLTSIEMVFREPLTIIFFLITLIIISPQLTLFVLILLPITALIIGRIGKTLKKTSASGQEKMGQLLASVEETLSGLRIIKAFSTELFSFKKFSGLNNEYFRLGVKMDRRRDMSAPLSEFMGAVVLVVVMWFGGNLVLSQDNSLSPEKFIGFVVIFSQIITPAKSFSTTYYNIQKGEACAERIYEILDTPNTIVEVDDPRPIHSFEKEIEYRNVSFAYRKGGKGWVLKNINLKVEKGKTIALVGQSGSGKTTLADMLPRFYDPTEGEVLIDGIPVKKLKIPELRSLMGIVTQESILFNDTVFNNIAFGVEHSKEEDVIAAAKVANAHEFIMEMPQGYQTNIGDRGGKLSGGQRQRISIARAVFKNPPVLILDEATSALDTESERAVQDALQKLMQNRTSLVIAHRLSTIQHASEIIVMQKGEIVERGTHSQLIVQSGMYKKLYDLQAFV